MSETFDSRIEALSHGAASRKRWNLSGRMLKILWEDIHPVILAYSWRDSNFRTRYADAGMKWRAKVVNSVAIWLGYDKFAWKEKWCIDIDASEIQFHISNEAIILPWPERPSDVSDFIIRYSVVGGLFPPIEPPDSDERLKRIVDKINELMNERSDKGVKNTNEYLEGDSILKLINQMTLIVSRAITDDDFRQRFNTRPESVITDISFSKNVRLKISDNIEYHDILINPGRKHINIGLPKIELCENNLTMKSIVNHIIIRNASNPMYSNCYC